MGETLESNDTISGLTVDLSKKPIIIVNELESVLSNIDFAETANGLDVIKVMARGIQSALTRQEFVRFIGDDPSTRTQRLATVLVETMLPAGIMDYYEKKLRPGIENPRRIPKVISMIEAANAIVFLKYLNESGDINPFSELLLLNFIQNPFLSEFKPSKENLLTLNPSDISETGKWIGSQKEILLENSLHSIFSNKNLLAKFLLWKHNLLNSYNNVTNHLVVSDNLASTTDLRTVFKSTRVGEVNAFVTGLTSELWIANLLKLAGNLLEGDYPNLTGIDIVKAHHILDHRGICDWILLGHYNKNWLPIGIVDCKSYDNTQYNKSASGEICTPGRENYSSWVIPVQIAWIKDSRLPIIRMYPGNVQYRKSFGIDMTNPTDSESLQTAQRLLRECIQFRQDRIGK